MSMLSIFHCHLSRFLNELTFHTLIQALNVLSYHLYRRRNDFVTTALESGKHVLVHYPVSSSLPGFVSLFDKAHECGRHLQDSTTFIHHHRVTEFLGRVLGDQDSFPRIKRITANLNVRMSFLDTNVWKCNPDWPTQGWISTLARFCVMFGMLIFNRIEYKPKSAQVMKMKIDSNGLPIEATCVITFDPVREAFCLH